MACRSVYNRGDPVERGGCTKAKRRKRVAPRAVLGWPASSHGAAAAGFQLGSVRVLLLESRAVFAGMYKLGPTL